MTKSATRLQRQRPKLKIKHILSFDIEYTRKEGILLDACIGDELVQDFYTTWDDIILALFSLGKKFKSSLYIIVHAGDIAEFPHLIQYIRTSHWKPLIEILPTFSGKKVVSLKIIKDKVTVQLHDLFAIFPLGLAKITDVFAPEYPKLKDAVDFSKRDYNPLLDREYLRRDVQATAASYKNIEKLVLAHFSVQLAMTAAGTAMRGWLYSLATDKKFFRLNDVAEDFAREGYYGAYVHPGKDNKVHEHVGSYDLTGAYGFQMKTKMFPIGNPSYGEVFQGDKLGLWLCDVTCINASIPMCPYRKHGGVFWLGLPGDSAQTIITTEEVLYFREHGYQVIPIRGYYWKQADYIFRDFMLTVEKVEGISPTIKHIAKLFRNSLYGRFGTKKFHESMVITDNPPKDAIPYLNPDTGELSDDMYIVEEELDVAYIQPQWAAYITAYQRITMFNVILTCGVENFLGCDTDSVKTYLHVIDEKNLPISETEYGKGKIEAIFDVYRSFAPKNYVGHHDAIYHIKSKGIPAKKITQEMMKKHLERDIETYIKVDFSIITNTLAMMKSDGVIPFNRPTHRHLAALHSAKWVLDDQQRFLPVRNMEEQSL